MDARRAKRHRSLKYFLATPLSDDFEKLRSAIAAALRKEGIEPTSLEDVGVSQALDLAAQRAISQSDFVIADVTGNNPNVMYEVGLANGLGKPVLPIVQRRIKHIPSYMQGQLFLVYDPSEPMRLGEELQVWVDNYLPTTRTSRPNACTAPPVLRHDALSAGATLLLPVSEEPY